MTVRINKQKINLREKLAEFEDNVNGLEAFNETLTRLGQYDGNVGIGTTNPGATLQVDAKIEYDESNNPTSNSGGIVFPRMSDAERDAISNPVAGEMIFNTGTYKFQGYTGAAPWVDLH
jgi:hypothetical protein